MPTPSNLFTLPVCDQARPADIASQRICEYQRRFSAITRNLSPDQIDQLFQTMQAFINTEYEAATAMPSDCNATAPPTLQAGPVVNEEPPLSKREQEVLVLISNGYNRREVGDSLGISINTAARHISNVYRKLKVTSVAEATQFALTQSDHSSTS